MLVFHVSALLAFLSTTAALPASQWSTQLTLQIDQTPLTKEPGLSAPVASSSEEIPSELIASSAVELLFQFTEAVTLENIATRENGDLLLTVSNKAEVYYFPYNGNNHGKKQADLLCTFEGSNATLGIVEITKDKFIVAVGSFAGFGGVKGSFSVWSIDIKDYPKNKPVVKKVTDIPEASALNGAATIEGSDELVLVADSVQGIIYKVNTNTGEYSPATAHPLYHPASSNFPLGVNGIITHNGKIHFINSAWSIYGTVPIDEFGNASDSPTIVATATDQVRAWDDLVIGWEGEAFIAAHTNSVTEVTSSGRQRNFTSPDPKAPMVQPTSLAWGRGSADNNNTLFVVAGGDGKTFGQIWTLNTHLI